MKPTRPTASWVGRGSHRRPGPAHAAALIVAVLCLASGARAAAGPAVRRLMAPSESALSAAGAQRPVSASTAAAGAAVTAAVEGVLSNGDPPTGGPAPGSLKLSGATVAPREPIVRVVIVPAMAVASVNRVAWYKPLQQRLNAIPGVECVVKDMPDPFLARGIYWLPFMKNDLKVDADTILIGHSSGAVAAMRYAETNPVAGLILVSAYDNSMGYALEQLSGYFDKPWNWPAIKKNAGFIVQFAGIDDILVPFREQKKVADKLGSELHPVMEVGHFIAKEQPAILGVVEDKTVRVLRRRRSLRLTNP